MNTRLRKTLYGLRAEHRSPAWDIGQYLLVMAALVWCTLQGTEGLGYDWQWNRVPRYLFTLREGAFTVGPLLKGLWITIQITLCSMGLSLLIGLLAMLLRRSTSLVARSVGTFYIESIRNTPLLIQLYVLYFVFAPCWALGRLHLPCLPSVCLKVPTWQKYFGQAFRAFPRDSGKPPTVWA